jgi:glycosyltransferase involved in cell wall biosynthesis
VSVIVAVLNGERFIIPALQSIFTQNYAPYEVIVVDGNSVDRTAPISQFFRSVKYICQGGRGLACGRNTGLEAAKGELIAFLDSDDLWLSNKLSTQVDYLLQNPEIHYVNAWVKFFVEPGARLRPGHTKTFLDQVHVGRTPGTLLARRSVFNLIGSFDPALSIACDVEWFKRAKDRDVPMFIIPDVLLYKRIHDRNLSSDVRTNRREVLSLIRRTIGRQRDQKSGNSHDR